MNQMIDALHSRYTQEQLASLPQYERLMQLHSSLMPLLPEQMREAHEAGRLTKRSPFSVDFLGLRVSYPQYLRLKQLQDKVIKLDQVSLTSLTSCSPASYLPLLIFAVVLGWAHSGKSLSTAHSVARDQTQQLFIVMYFFH